MTCSRRVLAALVALVVSIAAAPAVAGADGVDSCDCKRRLGLCQAEARSDGARVNFVSQTDQCVRIAFSIGGESGAITIRHGHGAAALGPPGKLQIDGCYVCDTAAAR